MELQLARACGIPVPKLLPFSSFEDLRFANRGSRIGLQSRGRYLKKEDTRFGYLIERFPLGEVLDAQTLNASYGDFYHRLELLQVFARPRPPRASVVRDANGTLYLWDPPAVFPKLVPHARVTKKKLQQLEREYLGGQWGDIQIVLGNWYMDGIVEQVVPRLKTLCQASQEERLEWVKIEGVPNGRLLSHFLAALVSERLDDVASMLGEPTQEILDWRESITRPHWQPPFEWLSVPSTQ
jgi:hypothetical protein